jgi:hypothetical protein
MCGKEQVLIHPMIMIQRSLWEAKDKTPFSYSDPEYSVLLWQISYFLYTLQEPFLKRTQKRGFSLMSQKDIATKGKLALSSEVSFGKCWN